MTEKRFLEKRETQAVKIARTAAEVWDMNAKDAGELAFISRILVQASLPHSDPKKAGWIRKNGNFTLKLKSGFEVAEDGSPQFFGLPYGTIPRLLFAWLNSEALRNAQDKNNATPHIIHLGRSLSEFLEKIGVGRTGGKNGGITRFKNQVERLFRAEITFTSTGENYLAERDIKISDGRFFFWNVKDANQPSLWENSVELSDRFYKLLINNPVPLDWRVLRGIKQSPMALDLYMWLTHRMSYLQKPVCIEWEMLQEQLAGEVEEIRKFRQLVRTHLKKITTIWKELNVDASKPDGIYLYPTKSLTTPTKSKANALPKKR
jgi:hypothetical protein